MSKEQSYKDIFTPANIVTTIRIALIPIFVVLILAPWPNWIPDIEISRFFSYFKPIIAAVVFALLALTDSVDGYLARSRNEVTTLGKFLDPLADKILVTAALLALVELGSLPMWIALTIITREFLVSGLRMVASVEGVVIAASILGKLKTFTQIIAVLLFLVKESAFDEMFGETLHVFIETVAWLVMLAALILTLLSLLDYFFKSSDVLGLPLKRPSDNGVLDSCVTPTSSGVSLASTDAALVSIDTAPASSNAALVSTDTAPTPTDTASTSSNAASVPPSITSVKVRTHSQEHAVDPVAILALAREGGVSLGAAESCTGGMLAAALTEIPGASEVFKGSIVSYANEMKESFLGVTSATLAAHGAVSAETAEQMARGARKQLNVDIAVSITGIAGPDGGSAEKPVGTVWFGLAWHEDGSTKVCSEMHCFIGTRATIRQQASDQALKMLATGLYAMQEIDKS